MNKFQKKIFNLVFWIVIVPLNLFLCYKIAGNFVKPNPDVNKITATTATIFLGLLFEILASGVLIFIWLAILKPIIEAYKESYPKRIDTLTHQKTFEGLANKGFTVQSEDQRRWFMCWVRSRKNRLTEYHGINRNSVIGVDRDGKSVGYHIPKEIYTYAEFRVLCGDPINSEREELLKSYSEKSVYEILEYKKSLNSFK